MNAMNILTLEDLDRLYEHEPFSGVAEYYATFGIVLPAFVRDALTPPRDQVIISYADGAYHSTAHPDVSYANIREAYNASTDDSTIVLDNSIRNSHETGIEFFPDESLYSEGESPECIKCVLVPSGQEGGGVLWLGNRISEEDRLVSDYMDFLIAYEKWKQVKDIATAWAFVAHHPVFWHKLKTTRAEYWTLENGWEHITMGAYNRDGEIRAYIDGGGYDERNEDYTRRYADVLLEIVAPTMDEAIIAFAHRVEQVFGGSNTENPGFEEKREQIIDAMLNR